MALPITAASLNLTQNCNLRCSYCFNGDKTTKRMSFETAKKCVDFILKEASEANINLLNGKQRQVELQFWGGEPLLEWDMIKDLVDYSENSHYKDVRVNFSGTTNGTLLTPEKFDFMQDHQVFFMVSLDGTPETHNRYRKFVDGRGSQEDTIYNVKEALKRWPFLKIRMSPYPERIGNFCNDVQYLVHSGINDIMWSPVYESNWTDEAWLTWEDQLYRLVDMVAANARKGLNCNIAPFNNDDTFDKYPCGAGRHYVGFDTEGEIYICHRFSKFSDQRPWCDKENCIGHVDTGITRQDVRDQLEFYPQKKGCPAINFDCSGDMKTVPADVRIYDMMLSRVRKYNRSKLTATSPQQLMNWYRDLAERVQNLERQNHKE